MEIYKKLKSLNANSTYNVGDSAKAFLWYWDDIVMFINGVSFKHSMAADNDDNEAGLI